jgi:hypothetical protein
MSNLLVKLTITFNRTRWTCSALLAMLKRGNLNVPVIGVARSAPDLAVQTLGF